jgi:hypothetical protein
MYLQVIFLFLYPILLNHEGNIPDAYNEDYLHGKNRLARLKYVKVENMPNSPCIP